MRDGCELDCRFCCRCHLVTRLGFSLRDKFSRNVGKALGVTMQLRSCCCRSIRVSRSYRRSWRGIDKDLTPDATCIVPSISCSLRGLVGYIEMLEALAVAAPPPTEQLAASETVPASEKIKEESPIIAPRKASRKAPIQDDDEPLVDLTEALALKSKKTDRKKKQQQKKLERIEKKRVKSDVKSFLELPPELLEEVLSYLRPSDIFRLLRLNRSTRDFVLDNEQSIAKDIIRRQYWVLYRCLQVPVALEKVDHHNNVSELKYSIN